tara:strand:- start:138 stop:3923 length:3786 start_codon:yes stop_codon:yes gene_type:complete
MPQKKQSFKLIDFKIYNNTKEVEDEDTGEVKEEQQFMIQMFGMNEKGETVSIFIDDFTPFFFIKVPNKVNSNRNRAKSEIVNLLHKMAKGNNLINNCKIIKRKKLYGFDNKREHLFMMLSFKTQWQYNKIKNLWYFNKPNGRRVLKQYGIKFENGMMNGHYAQIYEAAIPPFLRFFHMRNISPSGWITFKNMPSLSSNKTTNCTYEYHCGYKNIMPLNDKETTIPAKVMSFDIEASSSHGDFPLPKKTYEKISGQIVSFWHSKNISNESTPDKINIFKGLMECGFGYNESFEYDISPLYFKSRKPSKEKLNVIIQHFIKRFKPISLLDDSKTELADKKILLNNNIVSFGKFPHIEGDKVTFIGSTFRKLGHNDSYLNHMIVLNDCDAVDEVPDNEVECYDEEEDVLLAWTKVIQREDPDIIIGYNIFGFDWSFMVDRADELGIKEDFLKLSKNIDEECEVKESTTTVASGTYQDKYAQIPGRVQIDLLNYFRKEVNLESYKLDYVASHFISDKVFDYENDDDYTIIKSKNLMGLKNGHFVSFEIIAHSSDMYLDGKKFKIFDIDKKNNEFKINHKLDIDKKLTIKWCLNKDDIDHHQIFEYTNAGPDKRSIIAKYCFQDCNLCHTLMIKYDIYTGVSELSTICSVPMDFIIRRGQGIRLLSFIAKKCRENKTLMPLIDKGSSTDGYEGAIVLPPKKGFYADDPVAVVDYASLYPSSMISENISHDSKVWSKEYDLNDNIVINSYNGKPRITGIRDGSGNFVYDNLPGYKYVDIKYDTFKYIRKTPKGAAQKVKTGYKICRYAQFSKGEKAIMPSVLSELLASRKATKKLAKHKTITTTENKTIHGLLKKNDSHHVITTETNETIKVLNENVKKVEDRFNDFMKNVLDKRQLSKKIVANSLYGQCGAKTSSFYEPDIAASTTATGRKLLYYGKNIIEGCYGNVIVDTKNYGKVRSKAEYVYGDTDSVFFTFNLEDLDGNKIKGKKALEITIDLAVEAGELASKFLKPPHDLEYEKTFMPFLLLSKKRYVGMLHEFDINKAKRKSMGIVLKRRDNAPVVKDCYGGIIDILMKEHNVNKAVDFTKNFINDMVKEKFSLNKLIITKSLREFYKNPKQIAHKVLADRIGKREPGNKPSPGSRIPFVYIQTKGKPKLQGDRIEDPKYIVKNGLKPDFTHYITNQIQKPVQQIYCLVLDQINEFKPMKKSFDRKIRGLSREFKDDEEKCEKKITKEKEKVVYELIFKDSINKAKNKSKNHAMKSFFKI